MNMSERELTLLNQIVAHLRHLPVMDSYKEIVSQIYPWVEQVKKEARLEEAKSWNQRMWNPETSDDKNWCDARIVALTEVPKP